VVIGFLPLEDHRQLALGQEAIVVFVLSPGGRRQLEARVSALGSGPASLEELRGVLQRPVEEALYRVELVPLGAWPEDLPVRTRGDVRFVVARPRLISVVFERWLGAASEGESGAADRRRS
jgi:hypothetical protein